jgi:hypothetical protein
MPTGARFVVFLSAILSYAVMTPAAEVTSSKHYEHGGTVSDDPPDEIPIWRSADAMDHITKMMVAGVRPTKSDLIEAIACMVASGTVVSWVDASEGSPPTTTVIVREGPEKGCTGLVVSDEFKADKP